MSVTSASPAGAGEAETGAPYGGTGGFSAGAGEKCVDVGGELGVMLEQEPVG
jgi:hypothetical protein